MSGTDAGSAAPGLVEFRVRERGLVGSAMCLDVRYAMSGTELAYGGIRAPQLGYTEPYFGCASRPLPL
eukprot:1866654-Rhodomonas_salina.1